MKKIIYTVFISVFIFSACSSGSKDDDGKLSTDLVKMDGELPVIKFAETEHDFGTIVEGEKVSYVFKFKNTGASDLVISSARASCGCTVPEYPKTPIKPGEEERVTVTFDSNGKPGMNHKDVTIVTNCQPNTQLLKITVNVIKPEDKQE